MSARVARALLPALVLAAGCRAPASEQAAPAPSESVASAPPWDSGPTAPAPPEGMVWIPPGALVAGTPKGVLPRVADAEMEGEQVILKGFFMSVYPYPNEESAIPIANVTQPEARALCEQRGQRLCTELEWERACKGPDNHLYEYGDRYRADVCGTGAEPRMLPVGLRVACRSDFGVKDMHGGLWEWTSSPWGRGAREGLVAVRGGNAPAGELAGRCANSASRSPESRAPTVGFRCCAGPENEAKVMLHVERRTPLETRDLDAAFAARLLEALPDEGRSELRRDDTFRITRAWTWHPIGNEELVVASGCTAGTTSRGCGVMVVRLTPEGPSGLAWAGSGRYVSTLRVENDPRFLWVYGGDERSHFRRLLTYAWGRVALGRIERNVRPARGKP